MTDLDAYFAPVFSSYLSNVCNVALDCIVETDDGWRMTYPGGKGRLYQNIISMMPPHDTYIETHLGSGVVMRMKKPARRNIAIDIDPAVIASASSWQDLDLEVHNGDALEFLRNNELDRKCLIYVDPPYVASTKKHRRYYRYEYTDLEHIELLEFLNSLECHVLISGYDSELYQQRLHAWRRKEFTNITRGGLRKEVVWANFEIPADLHDFSNIGQSYRDRERIKRKAQRWQNKFECMPALERHAILDALLKSNSIDRSFASRRLQVDTSSHTP